MTFADAVAMTTVEARTQNGMKAMASTLNACVDLFYKIGASRGKNVTREFERAFQENPGVALRILQWSRDVRGGAGERKLFRDLLLHLEQMHKDVLLETDLLRKIPVIGRFDDLLVFTDPQVKERAFIVIGRALIEGNGLAAKWMPRKGPVAAELRAFLQLTPKQYRKVLVALTNVVETQMCAREFEKINFEHVPSLAMARYTKAFTKRVPVEFNAYKEALAAGTAKVNASAVYPYDIIKALRAYDGDKRVANAQWDALPNYIGDAAVLPMVDVSGSMTCKAGGWSSKSTVTCLDVAVSLGLYCASKNTGAFADLFLTFSGNSKFQKLTGTLEQRLAQMEDADWEMDTSLNSAFNEVLRVATQNRVAPEQMPKYILILSDMQFNECAEYDDSGLEMIRRKYEAAGYTVPAIIFWNINSNDNVPCRFDERGTALVSGFSPAIMKAILSADLDSLTPERIMLKAVMSDRYDI